MGLAQIRSYLLRKPAQMMGAMLRGVSDERLARSVYGLLRGVAQSRTPTSSVRFLLILDNYVRELAGAQTVRYGEGVHSKHHLTKYHDFFTLRLAPGERVLDIGAGIGALAHDMAERGKAQVTGIDMDEGRHAYAKKHFAHERIRYVLGDATRDLPGETFDTVVISNVLEHIEDRIGLIRAVQSRCKPKRWLIRVPAYERDWLVPLKDELKIDSRLDVTHFIEYADGVLEREVNEAGLRVVELKNIWGEVWCEASAEPHVTRA